MALPTAGETFGRYRVDHRIGLGGMGVVYAATDLELGRPVALKLMGGALAGSAEFLERFHREAELLARMTSPHVIAIYDHGELRGVPFIATQLVAGGDVGGLLARSGPLRPGIAAQLCAQVAEALGDAHRAGIVHRDVKPSNILLRAGEEPFAYLCDFGIAQTGAEGLTSSGSVAGTWAYLAPERAAGAPATAASDLYALGCVLWAMVTGRAPYVGSDVQVAIAHRSAPVPQFTGHDETSRRLNALVARAMAKDPAQRYPDAAAMRADLLALHDLTGEGFRYDDVTSLRSRSGRRSGSRSARARRRARLAGVAAAAAVLLAGGGAWWWSTTGTDAATGPATAPSTGTRSATAAPERPPVAGDLDGDGHGDVQLVTYRGSHVDARTWLTDRAGTGPRRPATTPYPGSTTRVLGRFQQRDGAETATVEGAGGAVTLTAADGSAVGRQLTGMKNVYSPVLLAGDFDGDGRDDLAWVRDDGLVHVANGGARRFARSRIVLDTRIGSGFAFPADWAVGDVDGDGRDDLVAHVDAYDRFRGHELGRSVVAVWHSTGKGFAYRGVIRLGQDAYVRGIVAADVDGDGRDEVVVADEGLRRTTLSTWAWDNTGPTRTSVTPVKLTEETPSFSSADLDGDGLADVLIGGAAHRTVTVRWLRATPGGFAQPRTWLTCRGCGELAQIVDRVG